MINNSIRIYDQTLRDGLMCVPYVEHPIRIEFIKRMNVCGIKDFEVARFPYISNYEQFKHTPRLLQEICELDLDITLSGLAMGREGVMDAIKFHSFLDQIHVPCFISDAYSQYVDKSLTWYKSIEILKEAKEQCDDLNLELTVGIGTFFGCPIDWEYDINKTLDRYNQIFELGVNCIMLGDTAGTAYPLLIESLLAKINSIGVPSSLRVHFHNTFGRALLNSYIASLNGINGVDASILGLGGEPHPYFISQIGVDNGNCATEEIYSLFTQSILYKRFSNEENITIMDVARWFADSIYIESNIIKKSSFAQLIQFTDSDEISQENNRH